MQTDETRAREVLADEYERGGGTSWVSDCIRRGDGVLVQDIFAIRAMIAFAAPPAVEREGFQARVQPWLMGCFGAEIAADREERNHRFLEESLELVQSLGCTASEAHQLVDYVYGRDIGEPAQEVGGVMVTLAALCLANGLDMHANGETELARIWTKVEAIRAKQAAKPKHSPLPMAPTLHPSDREAIARVVDPPAFGDQELLRNLGSFDERPQRKKAALAKADAILALSGSLAPEGGIMRHMPTREQLQAKIARDPDMETEAGPSFFPPFTEKGETK